MTNINAVEKMAELMQQMEENSPRVAALQYSLKLVGEKMEDGEKRIAELEAKCAELAAELSAVERICKEAVFITDEHYEQCPAQVQKMIRSLVVLKIPSYQAFMAEVRAQGVEMFASKCKEESKRAHSSATRDSWWVSGENADDFAAQLRKGVQS
jgi:chromosome segregation ATPase